ncbi:MAG TPA: hypothetical protein ENG70_05715 [Candidatus Cloacimonetes bacterium]|nr:hypothetical protein [Candidatus Cloacimonadota bacterium]HEX38330.1 hypothetical protein [Candidatus Cloacimonadota bacterium]
MKDKKSKKGSFLKSVSFLILFYFISQLVIKLFKKIVIKFNAQETEKGIETEVEIQDEEVVEDKE